LTVSQSQEALLRLAESRSPAFEYLPGERQFGCAFPRRDDHNVPAALTGLGGAIIATVTNGAAAGLKDTAEKAVKDAYDGLITFLKGRHQKHQNVGKK